MQGNFLYISIVHNMCIVEMFLVLQTSNVILINKIRTKRSMENVIKVKIAKYLYLILNNMSTSYVTWKLWYSPGTLVLLGVVTFLGLSFSFLFPFFLHATLLSSSQWWSWHRFVLSNNAKKKTAAFSFN